MLSTLWLVRHGEVLNPDHVVYADLPGFGLSATGVLQAAAAADRCRSLAVDVIVTSPLQRAVDTAAPIAAALALPVGRDDRLTEWALGTRWGGVVWEDLPAVFPGELESYLATPTDLPFAPETIADVAGRMRRLVTELGIAHPGGTAVLVSHQDPVQALRLALTGGDLALLHDDKPTHASVITLESTAVGWSETEFWAPEIASEPFPPVDAPNAL
jgi:broad specificity phosphatase PhoE